MTVWTVWTLIALRDLPQKDKWGHKMQFFMVHCTCPDEKHYKPHVGHIWDTEGLLYFSQYWRTCHELHRVTFLAGSTVFKHDTINGLYKTDDPLAIYPDHVQYLECGYELAKIRFSLFRYVQHKTPEIVEELLEWDERNILRFKKRYPELITTEQEQKYALSQETAE